MPDFQQFSVTRTTSASLTVPRWTVELRITDSKTGAVLRDFTEDENEILDGVGIESWTPLLAERDVKAHADALTRALDITQTNLGNCVNRLGRATALLETIKNSHTNGVGWSVEIDEVLNDVERTGRAV